LVIADEGHGEAGSRVEHGEVQSELVEALVEQARKHRGRAVQRVPGRKGPPALLRTASVAALLNRELEVAHDTFVAQPEGLHNAAAAHALEVLADGRSKFQPVPVSIDHGMA